MVKIRAWLDRNVPGARVVEDTIEIDDAEWAAMSKEDRDAVGEEMVDTLIGNTIDAGWVVEEG